MSERTLDRLDLGARRRGEAKARTAERHHGLILIDPTKYPRGNKRTTGRLVTQLDRFLQEHRRSRATSARYWLWPWTVHPDARDDAWVTSARIVVRLQPRARRDEIVGMRDGVVVARVTAPALEGRANRALCQLIARAVGVAPSKVTIVRGERSRDKLVEIEGIELTTLEAALGVGP